MKIKTLIASAGLVSIAFAYAPAPIVFDTPAADEKGMMVLGNGEVGAGQMPIHAMQKLNAS